MRLIQTHALLTTSVSATLALALTAAGLSFAEGTSQSPGSTKLQDLRTSEGAEREQALNEAIAQLFRQRVPQLLASRSIAELSPQQAAMAAIEKNLQVAIASLDNDAAELVHQEAQAVFDPVLELRVLYSQTKDHERTLSGTVNAQIFSPQIGSPVPGEIILSDLARTLSGIDRIVFQNVQVTQQVRPDQTIHASRTSPNGADESWEYKAALSQQLPWGVNYQISLVATDHDVFYDNLGHSFDKPWSSELILDLEIPLGKDFGPDSSFDTELKLADKARKRSDLALRATLNDTLLAVNLAYLQLLQALENLDAATDNRTLLETQQASVQRLYKSGAATNYDTAQVSGELSRALAIEDAAIETYVNASDTVATLIEQDASAAAKLYLPTSYTLWLNSDLPVDSAALEAARQNNPSIKVRSVDMEMAEIAHRNATRQTLPDIALRASAGFAQDSSVYGYDSLFDSLGHVTDPDVSNQTLGLSYRYPFGNAAVKARAAQSEGRLKNASLDLRSTENDVERRVTDALVAVDTTRTRLTTAQRQRAAAQTAYESLSRRADAVGDVSRNDLTITLRRLLDARRELTAATIEHKRAEAELLAAQGILSQQYASWSARNQFERARLERLARSGAFSYFLKS